MVSRTPKQDSCRRSKTPLLLPRMVLVHQLAMALTTDVGFCAELAPMADETQKQTVTRQELMVTGSSVIIVGLQAPQLEPLLTLLNFWLAHTHAKVRQW